MSEPMAKRIRALAAGLRLAWHAGPAHAGRFRGDLERHLTGSADRFEVEFRERAWLRARDHDGSLLGR